MQINVSDKLLNGVLNFMLNIDIAFDALDLFHESSSLLYFYKAINTWPDLRQ